MTSNTLKRAGLRAGLAITAALALCAFASVGSASAATQHWGGATQVPYGSSQPYSGKATQNIRFKWEFSGVYSEIDCGSVSIPGHVENPAGGGAGTIKSESKAWLGFQVGDCQIRPQPNCSIQDETIHFSPMQEVANESGKDLIRNKGNYSSEFGEMEIITTPGATKDCALKAHYTIVGRISASASEGSPGEYEIKNNELTISGEPFVMNGRFALSAPSGEKLALSSGASPNAPHWYLGSAAWNTLSTGGSSAYSSNGAMSLDLDSEIFGVPLHVSCEGAGNEIAGSLANPSGGGAGTTTASVTLGECSIPDWKKIGCTVQSPLQSAELSGVATEVGKNHTPAIRFSPAKGSVIAYLSIEGCVFEGIYEVEGKLIASSVGDGYFNLSAEELAVFGEPATANGSFALASEAGESLRLQP